VNRRSACLRFLVLLKASLVSSLVVAAQEATQAVSRLAGAHWSVDGDWTPTLEEVQRHLRSAHGIEPGSLDLDDLLTVHDNDHNRRRHRHGHAHKKPSSSAKGYARF
jgi:hypothetical protein